MRDTYDNISDPEYDCTICGEHTKDFSPDGLPLCLDCLEVVLDHEREGLVPDLEKRFKKLKADYKISIIGIRANTADVMGVKRRELDLHTRKREIVVARQVAMSVAKHVTSLSLQDIGDSIGRKDHATVLHACKTVKALYFSDKTFRGRVQPLFEKYGILDRYESKETIKTKTHGRISMQDF